MRVLVLRNSSSGRGRGRNAVEALLGELAGRGLRADVLDVRREDRSTVKGYLDDGLAGAGAFIVAGGDGTLHHSAPAAMRTEVPVYHFPLGTENLFARHFGMTASPAAAAATLARNQHVVVDTAMCNDRPFLLMGSIGFDSCIVERVAANRRGGITRGAYVAGALSEIIRPRFVPLTVHVDGRAIVADRPGLVIVANSRQYAARLDPARNASMTDGLLDVVFLPIASRFDVAHRMAQVARGAHMHDPTVIHATCREAVIAAAAEIPYQLDGEHAGQLQPGSPLRLTVVPRSLRVLTP